ncbi:hypothetical protein VCHENC02_1147A, partial [Vibrio harveyi]
MNQHHNFNSRTDNGSIKAFHLKL